MSAILNFINNVLHTEPIAILVDGLFWFAILLFGFPLAGVAALIKMFFDIFCFFFAEGDIDPRTTMSGKHKRELGIVITGCDSGFGQALALSLSAKGFVVFAGCLCSESLEQFQDEPQAIPFLLDVTSDKSASDAYKLVSDWLYASGSSKKKKRHLHALVNNAGIARVGPIDWANMSDFKAAMDVNCLGMVRCVKVFLPIFKWQAAEGIYSDARIVNMISMAGLFSAGYGLSPYMCSKHAADAFTCNLQIEMKAFNVKVTALNPTFHETPMANASSIKKQMYAIWSRCSKEQRKEYGEGTNM